MTGVYCYESKTRSRVNGHPDRCFVISFKVDNKKRWEKVGWESEGYTPQIALDIRAKRVRTVRHGEKVRTVKEIRAEKRKHNRTLEEIKEAYFLSDVGQAIKNSRPDLCRWEKYLKPVAGGKRVAELSPFDVERIKKVMQGKAPATIKHVLVLLRRIINFGVRHNLCPGLSFALEMPKVDNERTEYLTPAEFQRLVSVLGSWPRQDVARMVRMAILTGMRRGELFKLRIDGLDFQQGLIALEDTKGGKTEYIPMSPAVRELLLEQIDWTKNHYPESPFVFPGRYGGQRVDCSAVERIKEAAELPKSFRPFHGLRHHFAVTLANSGEYTLDMIGELLTHKDTKVTQRYAKFLPEAKKKAANRAAELLTGQGKEAQVVELAARRQGSG